MKTWLRLTLIVMSVGGGFAGMMAAGSFIFAPDQLFANRLIALFITLIYSFITISGLVFVVRPHETTPLKVGLLLQLPWLAVPGLVYHIGSAAYFFVRAGGVDEDRVGFNFDSYLGSGAVINLHGNHWNFGINLVAVVLLHLIAKSERAGAGSQSPLLNASPAATPSVVQAE